MKTASAALWSLNSCSLPSTNTLSVQG
uniref:Uncharacterized protein n=1 Tax=Anguilla anguilla TaxID=7936 RepID=A0A0E9SHJ9_ANGAN